MKRFLFLLSTIFSFRTMALGLAGVYPENNIQMELQQQREADEVSRGTLLGYGFSPKLNPSFNLTEVRSGEEAHLRAAFGNVSTWAGDFVQVAFVPGYSHDISEGVWQLCGEMSGDVTARWTPYGRVSSELAGEHDFSADFIAGVRWVAAGELDVILEKQLHRDQLLKAGVNWRWDQNIELNVEATIPSVEHAWGVVVIFQPGEY
nr:hypothetical protein BdHM001_22520 [Bdellovibrio sp. HM001]